MHGVHFDWWLAVGAGSVVGILMWGFIRGAMRRRYDPLPPGRNESVRRILERSAEPRKDAREWAERFLRAAGESEMERDRRNP